MVIDQDATTHHQESHGQSQKRDPARSTSIADATQSGDAFCRQTPPDGTLPEELRADLADARIAGLGHVSEAPVANVPAGILELGVVENIEEFTSNLEGHLFSDGGPLQQPEIGIVEAWAVEEPAVGSPESSENRVGGECTL
jgi:hypothetical protein